MTISTRGRPSPLPPPSPNPMGLTDEREVHLKVTVDRSDRGLEPSVQCACGHGGYHVFWTEDAGEVTCPGCLQQTDAHGVRIRNAEYPLGVGDEFTLHSGQVSGTYEGNPHTAIPGRYVVTQVGGFNGSELLLWRTDAPVTPRPFRCSAHSVFAILGEWSDYAKGGVDHG